MCTALAGNRPFKPLFGVKMIELNQPVLYGMSLAQVDSRLNAAGTRWILMANTTKRPMCFFLASWTTLAPFPAGTKANSRKVKAQASVCEEEWLHKKPRFEHHGFHFTAGKTPADQNANRHYGLKPTPTTNW